MRRWVVFLLAVVAFAPAALAGAGMWPLSNLPVSTLQKNFDFTPSATWVRHVQLASVRLAEGCSGSFVSPNGLVLTNHHCVVGCLEGLSNKTRDLMGHFFYAADRDKELKCPSMEIEQLVKRTNVTATVNKATAGLSGASYDAARRAASSKLEQQCVNGHAQTWRCEVVSLYHGGQFWLYKYRRYQHVRLVFAPSQQTAFFGGNPDNFNYPRYDYDVSFVRVYVHGKPLHTPYYFHVSPKGPKAGELVFTSGNPGRTERGWTMAQLAGYRYPILVNELLYLSQYRGLLEAYSAQSTEHARIAQGDLFFTDNAVKALGGMLEALNNTTLYDRKARTEAALQKRVESDPKLKKQYGDAWANIAQAEKRAIAMNTAYSLIVRREGFRSRLFDIAFTLVLGAHERSLPDSKRIDQYRGANLPALTQQLFSGAPVYPGYDRLRLAFSLTKLRDGMGPGSPIAEALFAHHSPKQVARRAVQGTRLADVALRKKLWQGGEKAVKASHDPMIALAREVLPFYLKYHRLYKDQVSGVLDANTAKIARARFALYGTSIYPDATFTERLSYGVVKGWNEQGKPVPPFTHIKGLYERAKGYPPLALAEPWLKARGKLDPETPMDFVTTNDIVGGNSGSPVINRKGVLVGLIFDGNLHSLGGSFWYNGKLNRAVAVDSRAILTGLKQVYGARHLVQELTGR